MLVLSLMSYFIFIHRLGHLLIPVPGTDRCVRVRDNDYGGMTIWASHPADIPASEALSVWRDHPLEILRLNFNSSDVGQLPQTITREDWERLLHYLNKHTPAMAGPGLLEFNHSSFLDPYYQSSSSYEELLHCLPPILPHLMAKQGLSRIDLWHGMVSGRTVLAFMTALDQKLLSVEKSWRGCMVRTKEGTQEVELCLLMNKVVGSRTTLEELRSLNPSPLSEPEWEEVGDG